MPVQVDFNLSDAADGIKTVSKAVGGTMGNMGRLVMLPQPHGGIRFTKDGKTVAEQTKDLEETRNRYGAMTAYQVAQATQDESGDGTSTSVVIFNAAVQEGLKCLTAGMNPVLIKQGMRIAEETIRAAIEKMSTKCDDFNSIAQVASISANSDTEIGDLLAKAMEKVGSDGATSVQDGQTIDNELEVVEGMRFDRGYQSPYFATNQQTMVAEYDEPYILLIEKKLSNIRDILQLLEGVAKSGRSLIIISEEAESDALANLVVNSMRGLLKVCAVKAPGFGDRRKEMMQDISVLAGAQFVSEELGTKLAEVGIEHLGTAKKVVITKDHTTIVNGGGDKSAISERVSQIKAQIAESTSDYDTEKLQERLAKLGGGVAVIKVGAATEVELKEKRARVEDALNATRAAAEGGVVPGGGIALIRAAAKLSDLHVESQDVQVGINIIKRAVEEPFRCIINNAGLEAAVVLSKVREQDGSYGYNVATGEYGDLTKMGIIDPTKVTLAALKNAASVAGMIITSNCMVVDLPEETDAGGAGAGGMGGMGGMPGMM